MIIIPQNIGAPEYITIRVISPPLGPDLTTVTLVTLNMLRRDGTSKPLLCQSMTATETELVAQYPIQNGDITTTGNYFLSPVLSLPGGAVVATSILMMVSSPFTTNPVLEGSAYVTNIAKIDLPYSTKNTWNSPVTSSASPFQASQAHPFIPVDSTAGLVTINLWEGVDGDICVISDFLGQAGTHTITIAGANGQLISDGTGLYTPTIVISNSSAIKRLKYAPFQGAWLDW